MSHPPHHRAPIILGLAGLIGTGIVARPTPARACGTFVYAEHESRPGGMNAQEILLALGEQETLMAVSAGYVESADEFAFLLPVPTAPSEVADGHPGLFYALEEALGPRTIIFDATQSEGCGCLQADAAGGGNSEDVLVVDRGHTATYEYVVVGGDTGATLNDWLSSEGFPVPPGYQNELDAYLDGGWLFLVARIRSDVAAGNLAPLQLFFAATSPEELVLPIGISAEALPPGQALSITLYLMANEQVLPANYDAAPIDSERLVALTPSTTNYAQVFDDMVTQSEQGLFVIEKSQQRALNGFSLVESLTQAQQRASFPDDLPPAPENSLEMLDARLDAMFPELPWMTRLRTELTADRLRDVTFQVAEAPQPVYEPIVSWRGAAAVLSGMLPVALILYVLIGRPRRRTSAGHVR